MKGGGSGNIGGWVIAGVAALWILGLVMLAALSPWVAPFDSSFIDMKHLLEGPSLRHWMGTDQLGRDILSRMLTGSRVSLGVGFVAVGIATVVGIAVGAVAGYLGGKIDRWLMAFVDIMLCFPAFFLILAVVAILNSPGIWPIMIIIGLTSWMSTARLIRAEVLSLREREFVLAAEAMGASRMRVLTRHLIPNAMGPVWVSVVLGMAHAILIESALSFLGLGVQPPQASWGSILMDGKASLGVAWWLTIFPGMAILLTVLAYNLVGEFIRERMNVKEL